MAVSIVILDNHQEYLDLLKIWLEDEPEINVLGTATDQETALKLNIENCPDVLIFDPSIEDISAKSFVLQVEAYNLDCNLIALSLHANPDLVSELLNIGVKGYVQKDLQIHELIAAIFEVAKDNICVKPDRLLPKELIT